MNCKKCGNILNEEDRFCTKCGEKVEQINLYDQVHNTNKVYTTLTPESVHNNKKDKKIGKTIGIIIGIILILFLFYIGGSFILKNINNSNKNSETNKEELKVFNGDNFKLKYNKDWEEFISDGEKSLKSVVNEVYLFKIGESNFSDSGYDFDLEKDRKNIYDDFYDFWSDYNLSNKTYLYKESKGFSKLKDNIFYATINYGKSSSKLNGKYYIVIAPEDNLLLTFMSNTKHEKFEQVESIVLDLLKNIEIDSKFEKVENKFLPGNVKDYTVIGYLDYNIPDCWTYDEELNDLLDYKSTIFIFKDEYTLLEVQAYSPYDSKTFDFGQTYEEFKNMFSDVNITIKEEEKIMIGDIKWNHFISHEYLLEGYEEEYFTDVYVAFSENNLNIYVYRLYIPVSIKTKDLEYLNDSMRYILENTEVYNYEV